MDTRGILGILAIVAGGIAAALGFALIVTWPYPLDVVAVVGGPLLVVAGVVLVRKSK